MTEDSDRMVGMRQIALLTAIPAVLLVGPLLGFWFGDFLDRKFGTEPWLMIVFIAMGLLASGRETWKLIKLASPPAGDHKE